MNEKLTAVQRLEKLLNEKDEEIEELNDRVRKAEDKAEMDSNWMRHRVYDKPEEAPSQDLPVPRLEIRWHGDRQHPDGRYEVYAEYCLVTRHLLGWIVFMPIGGTWSSGALVERAAQQHVDLPFRDSAHICNDMKQLKLRAFGICGDKITEYTICAKCEYFDQYHRDGKCR